MSEFLPGFADELVKFGGVGKSVAKSLFGSPRRAITSLMAGGVLADAGMSAAAAHRAGQAGAQAGRYLKASRHSPSRAAFTNYHQLFKHKPSRKEIRSVSKHHRPSTFSSYKATPKKD